MILSPIISDHSSPKAEHQGCPEGTPKLMFALGCWARDGRVIFVFCDFINDQKVLNVFWKKN